MTAAVPPFIGDIPAEADGRGSKLVPLNLVFEYPVRWSRYKVLRDLIQNFYDAVGHNRWHSAFSYHCADRTLKLQTVDTGFSFEWLLHIGASTKRDRAGEFAGYYGEGFKIAALCAVRDHGWGIRVRSRDWALEVTTSEMAIDGRSFRSLAYRIWDRLPSRSDTVLWVSGFTAADQALLPTVLHSFYYEQNPLFGECLWSTSTGAIWTRSAEPKPPEFPATAREPEPGIVFASFQARGSLEFPLIFCSHTHRTDDRERSTFYRMDVISIISATTRSVPAEVAAKLLERLTPLWYRYPRKRYDLESWYSIIRGLAEQVGRDRGQAEAWRQRHPNLLLAGQVQRKALREYNRRRQALDWLRRSPTSYKLVQNGFSAIGYETLEAACERAGGFAITRPPQPGVEQLCLALLEQTTRELCGGFFGTDPLPPCQLIADDRAVWMGMAICMPRTPPVRTPDGLLLRFRVPYVALKSSLLVRGGAIDALTTYLHELCHQFGGDRAPAFGYALTELLSRILARHTNLEGFERAWNLLLDEQRG